jgi:hypothetical protein
MADTFRDIVANATSKPPLTLLKRIGDLMRCTREQAEYVMGLSDAEFREAVCYLIDPPPEYVGPLIER